MKKISLIFGVVLFLAFAANAQAPLQKGEKQVNVGVGLSNWGLPIIGGVEFGMGNNISVGGELSYRGKSETYGSYKWKNSYTSIAGLANYHFNEIFEIPSQFDVYAGLSLGYSIFSSKVDGGGDYSYSGSGGSGLYLGAQVGARYFFTDKVAANVELGGANVYSGAKVGVTFLF